MERDFHKRKEIPSASVRAGEQPNSRRFSRETNSETRGPCFQLLKRNSRLLQAWESVPAHVQLHRSFMQRSASHGSDNVPGLGEPYNINSLLIFLQERTWVWSKKGTGEAEMEVLFAEEGHRQ